jgi:hypothetical protein
MGSGLTNFLSIVEARSLGTADIDKITAAIDKQSASLDKLGEQAKKINQHPGFDAFAEKVKQGIENPLQSIGGAVEEALKSMGPLGTAVAGWGGIFAAAGVAAFEAAKSLGEWGTRMKEVELRTGLSAKEVGEFSFAAKAVGQDISVFERGMRGLTVAVTDNGEAGAKARVWLGKFGVDINGLKEGTASTAETFMKISEGLGHIGSSFERNQAGIAIFKRAWIEMAPTVLELSEKIKVAQEHGFGFSDAEIEKTRKYTEQVAVLETTFDRMWRKAKEFFLATHQAGNIWGGKEGAGALLDFFTPEGPPPRPVYGPDTKFRTIGENRDDQELDARVRAHVEALNEAMKEARQKAKQIETETETFEKRMVEEGLDPLLRIFAARDELIRSGANRRRVTDAALQGAIGELGKAGATVGPIGSIYNLPQDSYGVSLSGAGMTRTNAVDYQEQVSLGRQANKNLFDMATKAGSEAVKNWDEAYKLTDRVGEKILKDFTEAARKTQDMAHAVERIGVESERSEIMARSGRTLSFLDIQAGPGGEGRAVAAAYQERQRLAQELYDFESAHALNMVDQAKAEADLHKAMYEADIEYELKVADLQRQRIERMRSEAGQFFDAMMGGGKGIEQFARNTALGYGRTIFSNVVTDIASGQSLNRANVLGGTPFGPDPLKDATMANTMATVDNTMALRALRISAMSGSGGGGGFSPVSASMIRGIFNGTGGSAGTIGSGETASESWGLPSGSNGDFGGETSHPAGSFNWGQGIGIGAASLGGGFGIYSGIKSGGARGALTAGGSALGATSAILGMLGSSLGPIGLIAGMGLGLITSLFGDPKQERANDMQKDAQARAYSIPSGWDYSADTYGRGVNYDFLGRSRPITIIQNNQIQAIDGPSLEQHLIANPTALSKGIVNAVSSGNGEDLVGTLRNVM